MQDDALKLDQLQSAYKAAVEDWIPRSSRKRRLRQSIIRLPKWINGRRPTLRKTKFVAK